MATSAPNRYRPAMEMLMERVCPSGITLLNPQTLLVSGDERANHVLIRQDDAANQVTVDIDGTVQVFRSDQVSTILVDLGGGADTLTYNVGGGYVLHDKLIGVSLGDGDDLAHLNFAAAQQDASVSGSAPGSLVEIQARLQIGIDAGAGDDVVRAAFGHVAGGDVDFLAAVGKGDDTATAKLRGDLREDSSILFALLGQGGNDSVSAYHSHRSRLEGQSWFIAHGEDNASS